MELEKNITRIVIAVDIGSSSIRCTAYRVSMEREDVSIKDTICSSVIQYMSVQPNTGKIAITCFTDKYETNSRINLLDMIDNCVDHVVKKLNELFSNELNADNYVIAAFGFSTFVMNFLAIDNNGCVLGSEYTMTYACNTFDVAEEVKRIKR